jgi:predicted transcriptional regulator of viral defense system
MPTKRITRRRTSTSRTPIPGARSGLIRSRDLEAGGTTRVALRRLVQQGSLLRLGRGIYAAADFSPTEHHGLAVASAQVPNLVVCLLSALQFHGLTTQAPFEVWLAIGGKARKPTLAGSAVRIVRFSRGALTEGIEVHHIEGVSVRITSAARTVADCFKYRNKIGLDVALEALKEYRRSRRPIDALVHAARVVRVANVMRPYLEAVAA